MFATILARCDLRQPVSTSDMKRKGSTPSFELESHITMALNLIGKCATSVLSRGDSFYVCAKFLLTFFAYANDGQNKQVITERFSFLRRNDDGLRECLMVRGAFLLLTLTQENELHWVRTFNTNSIV